MRLIRKIKGWMLQCAVHIKARDLRRHKMNWPDMSRDEIKHVMLRHCARQFDRSWPPE